MPRLGVSNQTVSRLLYGYLRDVYQDVGVFSVSQHAFSGLVRAMACDGAWQPVLEFLRDAIADQIGIRDYIDGEKVVHAFLAAHFSMVDHFLIHSERELNKGCADLPGALPRAVPGRRLWLRDGGLCGGGTVTRGSSRGSRIDADWQVTVARTSFAVSMHGSCCAVRGACGG